MAGYHKVCPDCGETFTKRSFSRHMIKYYDRRHDTWTPHKSPGNVVSSSDSPSTSSPIRDLLELSDSDDSTASHTDNHFLEVSGVFSLNEEAHSTDDEINDEQASMADEYDHESDQKSDDDDTSEDEDPEIWPETSPDCVDNDLGVHERPEKADVNNILIFFVGMLLYWQVMHHVSDNGLDYLIKNLFTFFQALGLHISDAFFRNFCIALPPSLYMARKYLNVERDDFKRYVVCQSCLTLYDIHDCFDIRNGLRVAKVCTNEVRVRGRRTAACGAQLMKEVICKGNVRKFYPIKVYCYNSIISSLEHVLKRQEVKDVWEHWKDWDDSEDLRDVYDGRVWEKFKTYEGRSLLNDYRGIGLMMNIDWFQPFKHRNDYSVGVIYFALLNLPRQLRYRSENIIIAGLIPAFRKEPSQLNSFLDPIVKELDILWKGIKLKSSLSSIELTFRAALLCVACDIPASRKCCGFKSHSAKLGCNKCFKTFGGSFGEKRDYSGFDRQNWAPRTKDIHNRYSRKVKNAKTKTEADMLSTKYGTYYSILIELPYFDAVTFCVIDPMHNLFLGTAKMVFKLWVENGVLTPKHLETIEGRLSEVNASTDIGRIPTHISGNYGVFSAAEWKNWTVSFSLYALCGILPQDDYRCWEKFVLACRILCKPYITKDDLVSADALLLNFCKSFERLYGPDKVTCNMHLHCHLKDCLLDFGPIHVFWCFSFERYNGAFGKFHTNNKGIEIQFMRKIMTSKFCETLKETLSSSSFFDTLGCLFDDERGMVKLSHTMTDVVKIIKLAFPGSLDYSGISGTHVSLPKAYKISMLDREDLVFLLASYRMMYPSVTLNISHFGEIIRKYPYISILGEKFGSKSDCRKLRSACVLACKVNDHDSCSYDLRPCRVDFYFSHTACIGEKDVTNVFAKVTWFREYQDRYKYGNALQMWFCNKYEESGSSCFMPVERIRSRFSRGITGASKDLMCICPVTRRIISDN